MGRQPWIVFGLMRPRPASRPQRRARWSLITLVGFTLLYGALAVVEVGLLRPARAGRPAAEADRRTRGVEHEAEPALGLAY